MDMGSRHQRTILAAAALAVLAVGSTSDAPAQPGRAVPAIFEQSLQLPGEGDRIRRPSALFFDADQGEILLGDSSRNRIVIFDQEGTYRYEFSGLDHFAVPLDVVVDSQGQILVLGSTRDGARIFRFDFDGLFLGPVEIDVAEARVVDLAIDEQDRVYVAIPDRGEIVMLREDRVVRVLQVDHLLEGLPEGEAIFGEMAARDDRLYVPQATVGSVAILDVETGEQVGSIGARGENPGELIFPVAVSLPKPGMITVLDKMRFAVVCYASTGRFLGEFGGKGQRDGWFYHPQLLAPAGDGRMIIGQIFEDRVQICRIPEFILERAEVEEKTHSVNTNPDRGSGQNSIPNHRLEQTR